MVVARSPFRISFLGGGTDLAAFFREEEGAVVSTTINKFVQIAVKDAFDERIHLAHTQVETVSRVDEIEHKIVRRVLEKYLPLAMKKNGGRGLDIVSMTDIPPGTGLGSSSSFTVALLHALKTHLGFKPTPQELAKEACQVEIEDLEAPVGKQDQYIAAFGGLVFMRFLPSGEVTIEPIACSLSTKRELQKSSMLFYTGMRRQASDILGERSRNTDAKRDGLREMKSMALRLKMMLESGVNLNKIGELFHEGWLLKKTLASGISGDQIDVWYERAISAGAMGGKIVGAGGGGFLMLLCEPEKQESVREELKELSLFPIEFENTGSRILLNLGASGSISDEKFGAGFTKGTGSDVDTSSFL